MPMEGDVERPAARARRLGAWLAELGRVAPGLLEAHLPGTGLGSRTREQLVLTVADVNGCRVLAWVHGAWQEFLGPADPDETTEALVAYARACAEAGMPLDATTLEAVFPAPVVRSTRATVARAQLSSLLMNGAGLLADELLSRRPAGVLATAGQVAAVALVLPALLPAVAVAGALKVAVRVAPALPEPELPSGDDANLVVHLLAEALPSYLGHTVVRSLLLWSPVVLAVGVRMEGTAATLRIGQGRVSIVNGIRSDALVIVEGGLEPLFHLAAGSIVRQLAASARRSRA
jgi:hypothetical protein